MTIIDPRAEIDVREAVRADLLAVFRIEKRSFDQPWPYAAFEQFLGSPGFLIGEDDGSIAGYVVFDVVDEGSLGHIKDIAVAPEYRQNGVGRTLLSESLLTLASSGAGRVKLEVRRTNEPARSLYSEFGFERHHVVSEYYADGEDAYVLLKRF